MSRSRSLVFVDAVDLILAIFFSQFVTRFVDIGLFSLSNTVLWRHLTDTYPIVLAIARIISALFSYIC